MLPVEHFHLKHVLQTVCALEAVILRSFGPEGGQVLFTRDTGQAMLSRSGKRILTALQLQHPLARMVVECVWKHSTVTGDGSKTFILLLASLLRMIHAVACKEPNMSHTHNSREAAEDATARRLADELFAFALEEMGGLIAIGVVPYGFCVMWEDFATEMQSPTHTNHPKVQKLLASFFQTRLSYIHCDFIGHLTCEMLRHLNYVDGQPLSALQFVNDNFPALHTPVSGFPISCSRLIEGQVIHRDFATPCLWTDHHPVKAVVLTMCLQPQLLSAGEVLEVGCGSQMVEKNSRKEKSVVELSMWSERSLECVFANLHSLGVTLLLSAVKQSAAVLALAAQAQMCVVECISEDELSLFSQLSGTTPVSDCWTIESVSVATLTFCRPILLGVHRYVHVAFNDLEQRVMVKPTSLVICAPGEGQTDQYTCAFQDAIRMLLTTCKPIGVTSTPKRILESLRNKSFHPDDPSNSITYNSSNSSPFQQSVLVPGCIIPAGGTFEFLLHHALLHCGWCSSASDNTSIPAVSEILANALLSVPRQIYSYNPRHFLHIQSIVLSIIPNHSHTFSLPYKQKHSVSLTQSHGTSRCPQGDDKPSVHCYRMANILSKDFMLDLGLESVSCKYELLLGVLQCVTSLLRVDMMLCTHTALHTQSHRLPNISWKGTEDEAED